MKKLASIAYALRYFNLTEEEESAYLPFSYQNIPQPVKTETRMAQQFGSGNLYEETVETFSDGSSFAKATGNL